MRPRLGLVFSFYGMMIESLNLNGPAVGAALRW